jgi:adenylate cyclase
MIGRAELASGHLRDAQEMTICFADLVGFTRLGGEVEVQELGSVAGRLAELAAGVATPEVRLVKTIGDAAMFVGPEPAPVVEAALELIDAVERAELPILRAGAALGPTLQRGGDFFGHAVNLASRVTGIARPGSVLCTTEVHDAIPDRFEWSFAGRHRLKGVADPVRLYRARPLSAPGDGPDGNAAAESETALAGGDSPDTLAAGGDTPAAGEKQGERPDRSAKRRRANRPRK